MIKLTPELQALALVCTATALMWIPYTLARIATRGLMGLQSKQKL